MTLVTLTKSAAELFGVRSKPKNARDRLIDKAIDLFYLNGFQAVGLDRVITETGVTKTTFYRHFESKEDLVIAALRRRDAWENGAWKRAIQRRAGDDPAAQLLAMFDVLDEWFNHPDFGGCMFINAAAEFPDPRDPVHQVAAEHKRRSRDVVRDQAKSAGAPDPEQFADLYTAILEGTLILRQVHGRHDAAKLMRGTIEQLIAAHIKSPSSAPGAGPLAK